MRVQLKNWVIPASVGVTSFGLGVGIGYLFAKTRIGKLESKIEDLGTKVGDVRTDIGEVRSNTDQLEFKFEESEQRVDRALQQTARVVERFRDEGRTFLDKHAGAPIQAAKDRHPSKPNETILTPIIDDKEDDIMINVFRNETERDDNWDYDEELKTRSPDHPYIIHKDEYDSNELDYTQDSLMYYKGDDVLCDDHDIPIYNYQKLVGELRFGHGSLDPSIVYVRNEDNEVEWEIILDHGYFQTEVLGQQVEDNIKHGKYPVLKFRQE